MRTGKKRAFRPSLESVEPRIVATAGIGSAVHAQVHPATHGQVHEEGQPKAHVAVKAHHEAPATKHHAPAPKHHETPTTSTTINLTTINNISQTTTITNVSTTTTTSSSSGSVLATNPNNGTTNQAWIELVNTTGQDLEYNLKLGPYANGQFLPFDIAGQGSNSVQYRMSSLISNGQRVPADFAIQFGNGPITPLTTGISQQSAQAYYIILDSNFQYEVVPFLNSQGPF